MKDFESTRGRQSRDAHISPMIKTFRQDQSKQAGGNTDRDSPINLTSTTPSNRRVGAHCEARITLGVEQRAKGRVRERKSKHIVNVDPVVLVAVIDEEDVDKLLEL